MRLDRFMAEAAAAYYARAETPFGRGGDFTTAPEISQAFGEVLGAWCAVVWERLGRPDPVLLVECGPGRGTLMADALRAVAQVASGFQAAARVHLVEASESLRAVQARMLPGAVTAWHDTVENLPEGPVILLGNEFLDALPIRQFVRRGGEWLERYVEDGGFVEHPVGEVGRAPTPTSLRPRQLLLPSPRFAGEGAGRPDQPSPARAGEGASAASGWGPRDLTGVVLPPDALDGAIKEVSEPALAIVAALAARLQAQSGAALFLDYGPAAPAFGDTLQAMRAHETGLDPLAEPGTRDLTAHVDFPTLAAAARGAGAAAHGPLPQGLFLQRLGLMSRAAVLAQSRPRLAGEILSGAERLVAAEGMGRLFKALALCDPRLGIPPGFEEP